MEADSSTDLEQEARIIFLNWLGARVHGSIHIRRLPRWRWLAITSWASIAVALTVGPLGVRAQTIPAPAGNDVRDTGLETYYLEDATGKLVPVPSLPYEEFLRLYELDRRLKNPNTPPQFSLERMSLDIFAEDRQAHVTAVFEVKLLADGLCAVPLRLAEAILSEPAKHEGAGSQVLESAGPAGGFVSWIQGQAEQSHTITMSLVCPVTRVGTESRLSLSLPRATYSSLRLVVPSSGVQATIQAPASLVDQRNLSDERTEFRAVGVAGDTQLAWGSSQVPVSPKPLLVEATGVIQIRVKGPGAATSEARLRLTSFGRRMDSVKIRLPAGSKPVDVEDPKYKLEFTEPLNGSKEGTPIVVVKFTEPTEGPIEVRLATEQTLPLDTANASMDVLGFEVIDALRHSGVVSLSTIGDWQVRWDDDDINLSRLGMPPPSLAGENMVAAFEYYQQPSRLPIRVQRKQTRVSVEPTYLFDVGASRAELTAIVDVRVRGSAASFLRVDLDGWEVTGVSDSALNGDLTLPSTEVTPFEIALDPPRRGDFQIRLTAERSLERDADTIRLNLPSIRNATTLPSTVIVSPEDNVILSSLPETSPSFDPEPIPDGVALPVRERSPLAYRYRGETDCAELIYGFARRPRAVSVRSDHRVVVTTDQAAVEQRLTFDIRYQPLDRLRLEVPVELAANDELRIFVDNEPVDFSRIIRATVNPGANGEAARPAIGEAGPLPTGKFDEIWEVPLALPSEGSVSLDVRFSRPIPIGEQPATLEIPTIRSAEGPSNDSTLSLQSAAGIALTVSEPVNWITELRGTAKDENTLYRTSSLPARIELIAQRLASKRPARMVVERSFLQSWFTDRRRQDRAVFRLSNVGPLIRFQLPSDVDEQSLQVLLNGRLTETSPDADRWQAISSVESPGQTQTLELAYAFPERRGGDELRVELPLIEGGSFSRQFYWQLVLPENEHLLVLPAELTSENVWYRRGMFWERRPAQNHAWLSNFSGGSWQQPAPASCNTYLASGFGDVRILRARTASRCALLFFSSGIVLLIGFLWRGIGWRFIRWVSLVVIVSLVCSIWLFPTVTILLGQAAVFGVFLVITSRCLDWIAHRRYGFRAERGASITPSSRTFLSDASHHGQRSTETVAPMAASANR